MRWFDSTRGHLTSIGEQPPTLGSELDPLDSELLDALAQLPEAGGAATAAPVATALWRAQVESRNCDLAARWLQGVGRSFYSIASAGHESNAAVALALRPTDPALLHYRSGAFYLARAAQAGRDGVPDILAGVTASIDEPIAGGRHKVFGHHGLAVIPQTSTIASHLPRAVGVAIAIDRARKLRVPSPWPSDAVVVCSFGDASLNHATAQAALNTAANVAFQQLPVPILFVCEDNGLGISVPTPAGWTGGRSPRTAAAPLRVRGRRRLGAGARDCGGAGGLGAADAAAGRAPPAHSPVSGPRRRRRRDRPTARPPSCGPTGNAIHCSRPRGGSSRPAPAREPALRPTTSRRGSVSGLRRWQPRAGRSSNPPTR